MKRFLKNHGKIAVLGIGNELKGDDGLGPAIAKKLSKSSLDNPDIAVFDGGTVPENYTGSIRKENPTHIILVDAVEMRKEPGYIRVVGKEEIANYNISTHAMPVSFLIKFMETTIDSEIILIGVQPKNMELAQGISEEIEKSVEEVVDALFELVNSPKGL